MAQQTKCQSEDCELGHCPECGCHMPSGHDGPCEDCQVQQAMNTTSAQTAAFGGNYEAAARHFGW